MRSQAVLWRSGSLGKTGRWWKVFLITLGAIILVELTQMLTLLGTCDVDDVTLNVLGAMAGYLIFREE